MKSFDTFISELRQSRKIPADESAFREYWVKGPNWSPLTQGMWQKVGKEKYPQLAKDSATHAGMMAWKVAYKDYMMKKYSMIPEKVWNAIFKSYSTVGTAMKWNGEKFPLSIGIDERDLLWAVISSNGKEK